MAAPDRPSYAVTPLDDVPEIPILDGALRWKPVRRALDLRAFGVNAYAADAGRLVVEPHSEASSGHEELYVVVRGRARFTLAGEERDVPAGSVVFADPSVERSAVAQEDGTLVMVVGGDPAGRFRVSTWEDCLRAEARSDAGDHDGAIRAMTAVREDHEGSAEFHYRFARVLVRAGRLDEAASELNLAAQADAEQVRRWAEDDTAVLEPLRERSDWPLA